MGQWVLEYRRYYQDYADDFESQAEAEDFRAHMEGDEMFAVRLLHDGAVVRDYLREYREGMADDRASFTRA